MNPYAEIFSVFQEAKIKYLLVGGVAVNLYGYSRFTGDIDILAEESLKFDKLYKDRSRIKVCDITVLVVSIDYLISMKKKAARGQDLIDLKALLKLKCE